MNCLSIFKRSLIIAAMMAFAGQRTAAQPKTLPVLRSPVIRRQQDDSTRVQQLLEAAMIQIKKQGEYKADLDSADGYIAEAAKINEKLDNDACSGLLAFTRANLNEERFEFDQGKANSRNAIKFYLRTGTHAAQLADAYHELSQFCSFDQYQEKVNALSNAILYYHKAGDADREAACKKGLADLAPNETAFLKQTSQAQLWRRQLDKAADDSSRADLLLKLANFEILKPGSFGADLDTAANLVGQVQQINDRLHSLRLSGLIALAHASLSEEHNQFDNSKAFSEQAIRIFTRLGKNYASLGEAYMHIAVFYSEVSITDCREALLKSLSFYRMAGDSTTGVAPILNLDNELRQRAHNIGDFHTALFYALEGEKYIDSANAVEFFPLYSFCLADIYSMAGLYDESMAWAKKGMEFVKKNGNASGIDYYDLVRYYAFGLQQENRIAEELAGIQAAIRDIPPVSVNQRRVVAEVLGRCYLWLHQNSKGEACYAELERLYKTYPQEHRYKDNRYYFNLALYNYKMAVFYDEDKKYQKAAGYLHAYDTTIRKLRQWSPYVVYLVAQIRYQVDSGLHNYAAALREFQHAAVIKDSMFNETKSRQISELTIKYQTAEKDSHIKLLQSQETGSRVQLQKVSLERNLTIAGILLSIAAAAFAFRGYRQKQRRNRQLDKLLFEKENLLADKEVLIREIHHRVKNNLHMISSLLESQSAYLADEAFQAVQMSQHRVQAISLLHQKLYVNENVTEVLMSVYLREIVSYLRDSFISAGNISFLIDLDPIYLDVAQAVPLGLIVNEAITNSIKYAFPDDAKGSIAVSLKTVRNNEYVLRVVDDGVGLGRIFETKRTHSLGMNLIRGLGKNLQGTVSVMSTKGTIVELTFPRTPIEKDPTPVTSTSKTKFHPIV